MRSFWISLLVFILLMCSCKTKKFGSEVDFTTKEAYRTNHFKYQALADTSNVLKIEIDKSKLKIIETIIITEYDAESGKPIKETKAKRETTQDSDKVATEEETKGLNVEKNDSLNHFIDANKMVDEKVKDESEGGQEAFWKWSGIVFGCFISCSAIFLLRKLRVI